MLKRKLSRKFDNPPVFDDDCNVTPREGPSLDMDKAVVVTSKTSELLTLYLGNLERKFMSAQLKPTASVIKQ